MRAATSGSDLVIAAATSVALTLVEPTTRPARLSDHRPASQDRRVAAHEAGQGRAADVLGELERLVGGRYLDPEHPGAASVARGELGVERGRAEGRGDLPVGQCAALRDRSPARRRGQVGLGGGGGADARSRRNQARSTTAAGASLSVRGAASPVRRRPAGR